MSFILKAHSWPRFVSQSVMSNSLWPHGLQHASLPCSSPSPRACSNSCSPPAFNLSQHQGLFQWVGSSQIVRWPECWSFGFSISPFSEYSGLISFRIDWFDLLADQGTLKSLLQHHNSKASILQCSAFFMVQFTSIHDYWKNHSFDYTDFFSQSDVSTF